MVVRRKEPPASTWYLLAEIVLVLGLGAILVKAVAPPVIFASAWGRLYHPARTIVMLGFVGWLLSRTGESWRDMGLRRPESWLKAVGVGIGAFVTSVLLNILLGRVLVALGLPKSGDIHLFMRVEGNLAEYLYFLVPVSFFVAAFGEELIGRGYLI